MCLELKEKHSRFWWQRVRSAHETALRCGRVVLFGCFFVCMFGFFVTFLFVFVLFWVGWVQFLGQHVASRVSS